MSHTRKVAVLVGSLRKGSFSRKAAQALAALADDTLAFEFVEIGDLPYYNEDLETAAPPAEWTRFRDRIDAADAVLFVTPEYNRSVPAVLKNAVDVGSRPYGAGALSGKPAAVMSISPGALGGFGANHHLRQSLAALGMPVLPRPEAYIGGIATLLDDEGGIGNDDTRAFFKTFVEAFAGWIEATAEV